MASLEALLLKKYPASAYLVSADLAIDSIQQLVERMGFNFLHLDGRKIATVQDFFRITDEVLKFPDSPEDSWEAFADMLYDLENIPWAKGNLILYDDFQRFEQNDDKNFYIAFRHLISIAEKSDSSDRPMYVLLSSSTTSTIVDIVDLPLVDYLSDIGTA